jgi:hypothetical protein
VASYKNLDCPVDELEGDLYGTFANAFRLRVDGQEVLVEFCVWSESQNRARVVSRVRVAQDFLPVVHQVIGQSLNLSDGPPMLFVMPPVQGNN